MADETTSELGIILVGGSEESREQVRALLGGAGHRVMVLAADDTARELVAVKAKLDRANELLETVAAVDILTGIPNLRTLDDFLELEWRRSMREQTAISLLIVEVDSFGELSPEDGALRDRCLQQIAAGLEVGLRRPWDLAGRFDDRRFVVILPNTDLAGAAMVAQSVLEAMRKLAIAHPKPGRPPLTVSVGVAGTTPVRGASPTQIVEAANDALERARAAGGDRVAGA